MTTQGNTKKRSTSDEMCASVQDGNTNKRPAHKGPLVKWQFTVPYNYITNIELWDLCAECAKMFYFQGEKSNDTSYLHWQGCLALKERQRFEQVKNLLGDQFHIEPAKHWNQLVKYCQKKDTRIEGPYDKFTRPINILHIDELFPWEKDIIQILAEPVDRRTVIWIYDTIGGAGKTTFSLYLIARYKAQYVTNAKNADIAYYINNPKIVIFDFSRTLEGHINYGIIEQVKNGIVFSPKYESGLKIFDPPYVICFANFKPFEGALSADRWWIREIQYGELVG